VWHVYPDGGIGAVCERLAEEVSDAVETQSPVEAIHVENGRAVGVRVRGEDIAAAGVVSTAPVHVLPKLVRGTDALSHLSRFRYRPMAFVNVKLDGSSGLPDVVTWTPGRETPFFRLSDIGMGLPWLVPNGKSLVTCDIGCEVGDATWAAPDEELGRLCVAALDKLVPGVSKRYLGCRVMRTPLAYPVYRLEYEADRLRFEQGTGVEGLVSVGRNGEFAHILMEDVYWRTRRKVMGLIGSGSAAEAATCSR
jgi:protoporphyrinogen/coproporphyrinogen III oxidase